MKSGRLARGLALGAALFMASPSAFAQVATPIEGVTPGAQPVMGMQGESTESGVPTSPRSVKLFDSRTSINALVLSLGPVWTRKAEEATPSQNRQNFERETGEISLGSVITTPLGPFYISGSPRTLLRIFDSKKVSWSVFQEELSGGIRLGPLEPEVGFGASILSIDVFNAEWSAQLLSPRVSAGLGLRLGKIKVDIKGHAEYLWRWFGPDYYVRGITLGVQFETPKKNMFRDDPGPK